VRVIDFNEKNPVNMQKVFQIGHSQSESMTFLPLFQKDLETGIVFTDVAGLLDTKGEMIEFINSFIMRKMFSRAKTVRFLAPITVPQIQEGRGTPARQQVKLLQQIC